MWLESCKYNSTYTFLIFTNDTSHYNYPKNVKIIYTSFEEIKSAFGNTLKFDFVLDRPYKLCDYKVAYGDIFFEYIKGYDFWGYCDLDVIFGNLDKLYPDKVLEKYDKISERGHFALFKNTNKLRTAYKLDAIGTLNYKKVFTSRKIYGFDESWYNDGINDILMQNGFKVLLRPINYADILKDKYGLRTIREQVEDNERKIFELKKKKIFYLFDKGSLYQYSLVDNHIFQNEELYIHLLKRKMKNKVKNESSFLIVPKNIFKDFKSKAVTKWNFIFIKERPSIFEKIKEIFLYTIPHKIKCIKNKQN